jgi:hypothetical protein
MSQANPALQRLLHRAERARSRGANELVTLTMTQASCPEYGALESLDALDTFHAQIALAERSGAISADRDPRNGGLKRLRVISLDDLAVHLGIRLLSDRADEAAARLSAWVATYPVIARVLDAWKQGKKVRGSGPEATRDLVDAVTAVESRARDTREERILRRESIRLFNDSKRLERLTPWLEVLVNSELATTGLSKEDIWAALGLRREPQPMLLAGPGTVKLGDGPEIALARPYLGIPVDAVTSIDTSARYLLTIENLASFHDAARAVPGENGLLIYTAGMPSPAWRALYARIVRSLPPGVGIYHWGDIDEGGFRIAASLSATAAREGRILLPWLMSPLALPALPDNSKHPTPTTLSQMVRWASIAGWTEVGEDLRRVPVLIEQESLEPTFPDLNYQD